MTIKTIQINTDTHRVVPVEITDDMAHALMGRGCLEVKYKAMLEAAPQPELVAVDQQPVAWMNKRNGFICKENKNPEYNAPLYTAPPDYEAMKAQRDALINGLLSIKSNLMHTRMFASGTLGDWRKAAVAAEGDIEELIASVKGETK